MTATVLASIAGVVLSLAFNYIPGLNTKFAALSTEIKRLIMLGILVLVAAGAYGLSCAGWWPTVTCDEAGIKTLLEALFFAAVANQTTYQLTPQLPGVKIVKQERLPY
jgi:hypothetical protein